MKKYSIVGQKHRGLDPYLPGIMPGVAVALIREPNNPHDANAVAVWIEGKHVGYLSKNDNRTIARFIDEQGADIGGLAMDAKPTGTKWIAATFRRSPNSSYPQVEIREIT